MEFPQCKVKSVKADIANGELTISFGLAINDESLETAASLAMYCDKDAGKVEVRVIPQQLPLVGMTASVRSVDPATGEIKESE